MLPSSEALIFAIDSRLLLNADLIFFLKHTAINIRIGTHTNIMSVSHMFIIDKYTNAVIIEIVEIIMFSGP